MQTIRHNVFETNSSSEHVFTVTNKSIWERFEKGELFYDNCAGYGENPFKTPNKISEELAAEYSNLPKPIIEAIVNELSKGESCDEFKNRLFDLIDEFSHNNYSHHYFTINDMRELSDNFTYGDSNIDDSSDDKVSVNIEWYE